MVSWLVIYHNFRKSGCFIGALVHWINSNSKHLQTALVLLYCCHDCFCIPLNPFCLVRVTHKSSTNTNFNFCSFLFPFLAIRTCALLHRVKSFGSGLICTKVSSLWIEKVSYFFTPRVGLVASLLLKPKFTTKIYFYTQLSRNPNSTNNISW